MACKRCEERGKTWNGADPRCAFLNGVFDTNNWNCATANAIREIFDEREDYRIYSLRDEDQNIALLSTLDFDVLPKLNAEGKPNRQPTSLWVGWYKERGRTEGMYLMFEYVPPCPPTEEECLKIIAHYNASKRDIT